MNELLGTILVVVCVFGAGIAVGKHTAENKHLKQEAEYASLVQKLREQNQQQAATHNKVQADRKAELEALRYVYEARIKYLNDQYADSLLDSEARGEIYRERECTAPVGDTGLAEHATRLDRTVAEGRALVAELTEALRQCTLTYEQTTEYLLQDRSYLDGTNSK